MNTVTGNHLSLSRAVLSGWRRAGSNLHSCAISLVLLVALAFLPAPAWAQPIPVGRVVAWGRSVYGETNVPAGLTNVVRMFVGANSASKNYALRLDGSATNWGSMSTIPAGISNVAQFAIGANHVIALKSDGTLIGWGNNDFGQTNIPAGIKPVTAIAAGGNFTLALQNDGTVVSWRPNLAYIGSVPTGLSNVVAIAAGQYHSLALKSDGTVVTWGGPYAVPFPVPAGLSNVAAIAAGVSHSLALKTDGTVVAWGDNTSGQCSVPVGLSDVAAIVGGGEHSLALRSNGTVVVWGSTAYNLQQPPSDLTNVIAIASGWCHNLALRVGPVFTQVPTNLLAGFGSTVVFQSVAEANSPILYQWFFNGTILPNATNASFSLTNVQAQHAGDYTVRATADGYTVAAKARLAFGSLPAVLKGPEDVRVFPGSPALFRVNATNAVPLLYQWSFGEQVLPGETNSSLSLSKVQPAQAGRYSVRVATVLARETNLTASLFVLSTRPMGKVVGWGENTNVPAWLSGVVAIAAGDNHSTALRADGTVVSWGENSHGETNVPAGLDDVIAVAAGSYHSLALKRDGSIIGWGFNYNGQSSPPGILGARAIAAGNAFSTAVTAGAAVIAWGNSYGGALNTPDLTNAVNIAAGYYHALAATADGRVAGWGDDTYRQSSGPSAITNAVAVAAGHMNSMILCADGTVRAFGFNFAGQTNVPADLSNVVSIAANYGRCLASRSDGIVVGWGLNTAGQANPPAGLSNVVQVAAGLYHSLGLKETGIYIQSPPQNATAFVGTNVAFTVKAVGVSPLSYQWLFNGEPIPQATNDLLTLTKLQFANAGSYSVRVTSARGSEDSAPATLSVLGAPIILSQPLDTNVLAGSSVTLSVLAQATPAPTYQWQSNSVSIPGANQPNLLLTNVWFTNSPSFRVVVSNTYGAAVSAGAKVTVLFPPAILKPPTNLTVVLASNAFFSASIFGTPPLHSQWQFNGQDLLGATNASLLLTKVQSPQAGDYRIVVTNLYGSVTSSAAFLTVAPSSPTILGQPASQWASVRAAATFAVHAIGAGPLSYQWRFKGVPVTNGTQASLVRTNLQSTDAGIYDVIVSNWAGSVTSAPAMLQVWPHPNVVAWGLNSSGQTNVPLDLTNAVYIAAGSAHALAATADGRVVAWGANDSGQSNVPAGLTNVVAVAAGNGHSVALRQDGTVIAWGDNTHGQTNPPAGLTNVVKIVAGSLGNLALRADGSVVGWGYNAYSQASPPATLTNAVDIAAGFEHSIALKRDGTVLAWGYYYGNPSGISNITAVSGNSFRFLLLRKDGKVQGWPSGTLEGPTDVLAVSVGGHDYNATPHNLAIRTNRTVAGWGDNTYGQATPPAGLSNATMVAAGYRFSLTMVGGIEFMAQPQSQSLLEGASALLFAEVYSGTPISYQWRRNGVNLPGATNSTLLLPEVHADDAGTYTLVASNSFGVLTSLPATVSVALAPRIVSLSSNQVVNEGQSVTFTAQATGATPLSYQWQFNGTNLAGAFSSAVTLTNLQRWQSGSYTVVVTNVAGRVVSSNITMMVNVPPTVAIVTPPDGVQMIAPAGFTLVAEAADDLALTQVTLWQGTNQPLVLTGPPWFLAVSNLPPGVYPYQAMALDAFGLASTSAVSTVTVLAQPTTTVTQPLNADSRPNPQTGLFEEFLRVTNPTPTPLGALRIWVYQDTNSLARQVSVWNATVRSNGVPFLLYDLPLAPNTSVDFKVEYYVPDRRTIPASTYFTEVLTSVAPPVPEGTVLTVDRILKLAGGDMLVEFNTLLNRIYYVQYSGDGALWQTALPAVVGNGTKIQWIDSGPPKTGSSPSTAHSRLYRLVLLP
jgi:alpha-tubulin suppressor-like RCC1 family protein